MIELESLSFTPAGSDRPVLADVSLTVRPGERVGIVGPSGSGKSTLGYHLCGAHRLALVGKTAGRLRLGGRDCLDGGPPGLSGLVGQNPESQLFCTTVSEEIGLGLRVRGLPEDEGRAVVKELLDRFDLTSRRDAAVSALSLGLKQKTAIASMLAVGPRILLLDEPTSYLDAASADRLFRHLVRLSEEEGWVILVIEHDLRRLAGFTDRFLALREGRLVHDGPAGAYASPGPALSARALAPFPRVNGHRPLVSFSDVTFGYGKSKPVLRNVTFAARPGECVAITGDNGSGKTTLLRLVKGLGKASSGRIDLAAGPGGPKDVGLMFQNPDDQIFAHTVTAECGYWLGNLGVSEPERGSRVGEALSAVGLGEYGDRAPFSLSFGEKRRLCLASMLVAAPSVLCLDEPTTGLDDANMGVMAALVRRQAALGKTILIATHERDFAVLAASRLITLENGRIVADRPNPGLVS